jgi:fructoselysine-6-P-deglycase FrlB-like protein
MHKSFDEIFGQGTALAQTLSATLKRKEEIKNFFLNADFDEIVFVACGSSYWASMSACMTMQEMIGKPCSMVKSGDMVMNKKFYQKKYRKPLIISPSRSGATSETLIALTMLKESYDGKIFSIVEYEDSPILDISDFTIELPWANEISICQTRSFSCLYLCMVLVAAILGKDESLIADLRRYINDFTQHSENAQNQIRKILEEFKGWDSLVALGNGRQYGTVVEGAYINIEMAQIPAHYYTTLEWRHGPIVISKPNYLVAITSGIREARALEENMAAETRETGAKVFSISGSDDFAQKDYGVSLGWEARQETVALFSVMVMQGIAYHQAIHREVNPDKPGNLASWIAI